MKSRAVVSTDDEHAPLPLQQHSRASVSSRLHNRTGQPTPRGLFIFLHGCRFHSSSITTCFRCHNVNEFFLVADATTPPRGFSHAHISPNINLASGSVLNSWYALRSRSRVGGRQKMLGEGENVWATKKYLCAYKLTLGVAE